MAEATPEHREYEPIDIDARGRVSLARLHPQPGTYLGEVQADGTVVLHPASVRTAAQAWLDARPDLREAITELNAHPERAIRRGRPRRNGVVEG
jgi:hypothetical protein